jgi:hypothetical protein
MQNFNSRYLKQLTTSSTYPRRRCANGILVGGIMHYSCKNVGCLGLARIGTAMDLLRMTTTQA